MPFEEEKIIDDLRDNVDRRQEELESARLLIERRVQQEAHMILLEELENAIAATPEFQHDLLIDRLFNYFDDIENIVVRNREVLIHADADSQGAKQRWLLAKAEANAERGKKPAKSRKQAAAYWKYFVYGTELYHEAISERLALLESNDAPYWAFLEHGTGAGAWPMSGATYFLSKTRRRAAYLYDTVEREVMKDFYETPIEQPIRYSRTWTTSTGKSWSFVFEPGKAKRVVQI